MLKGDSSLFTEVVFDNIRLSFYLVYPVKNDEIENRLEYCLKELKIDLLRLITNTGVGNPVRGQVNRGQFLNYIKWHMYILLLRFTPNLKKLVNTRLAEFMKYFNRFMLAHLNKWRRVKNEYSESRSRRVSAKRLSTESTS
jgi:hypothetical protein